MRGRKPAPLEQRRIEGNPRQHALPDPVLIGGRGVPATPQGLTPAMRAVWRLMIRDLAESGVLDRADAGMVEAAAVFLGRAREARKLLNTEGILAVNSQGRVAHPAIAIERGSWTEFRQIAEHMGLSPAARARLGLSGHKETMTGELERQIGRAPRLRAVDG